LIRERREEVQYQVQKRLNSGAKPQRLDCSKECGQLCFKAGTFSQHQQPCHGKLRVLQKKEKIQDARAQEQESSSLLPFSGQKGYHLSRVFTTLIYSMMRRIVRNPSRLHILSQNVQGLGPEKEIIVLELMNQLRLDAVFIQATFQEPPKRFTDQEIQFRSRAGYVVVEYTNINKRRGVQFRIASQVQSFVLNHPDTNQIKWRC
jgi:hypothetical protein